MSFYRLDPPYDPDDEDLSEVPACHHCRDLITPGKEIEFNGWQWCANCVPLHVLEGREQEARDNERLGK